MKNPHRSGTNFCEFSIIFCERESGRSKFSRKILYEGMRFPLKAFRKRVGGIPESSWTGKGNKNDYGFEQLKLDDW